MAEALTALVKLLVVREIQEDEGGATLRFQQGGAGRLAISDANYAAWLRLARRGQERQQPAGVAIGEGQIITELVRADNDVPAEARDVEPDYARVLFQGHDGVFRIRHDHPESGRFRALLGEAI